jgi:predicted DNA-binding transcriptional regulator YafY
MSQAIIQAIRSKNLIEFIYGGHKRVVEPHVLGMKDGMTQLLGYQIGGSSSSGGIPEWRRFDLPNMSGLKIRNELFLGARSFPSGKHSEWDSTIAIVS